MKTTSLLVLLCALSLIFIYPACQRDDYGPLPVSPITGVKVQTTVSGRVLDDQQIPVAGAVVKAGGASANTDLNGNFQLKNITLNDNASFVKVEKAGFFSGSRTFKATKGSSHFVSIQLIKKNDAGNFSSATGGSITVPNGGTINFEAGSVFNAQNNTPYTGTVSVSAYLLDPTTENFLEIMPGDLRGIDENNKEVGLESFGMMAVELTGAGGEKLQLVSAKPATIRFPIAAAQLASAPSSIAFWSFNDTTGLWKQEGMATRQGNEYIGKASHFSFWNCDAPFPVIDFKATIKDQDGNPLRQIKVVIKTADEENGPTAASYTDTAGVISGKIPSGKKLKMIVLGRCDNELLIKEIGPLSGITDLGAITVTVPADSKITFTGEVLDCTDQLVQNGYVEIGIQGITERAPIVNGLLNYSMLRCGSGDVQASIRAIDVNKDVVGDIKQINVVGNTASVGQIIVCGENLTDYLIYEMGTIHRAFLPPADTLASLFKSQNIYSISYYKEDTSNNFFMEFTEDPVGATFSPGYFSVHVDKVRYEKAAPFTIQINEHGATAGEYMSGTFSGSMIITESPSLPALPINGRFRLKRKN